MVLEEPASQPKSAVIGEAVRAIERRDWDALKPLLHPYLHWTTGNGRKIRGRTQVMTHLRLTDQISRPHRHELRDGQIYRWLAEAEVK